MSRDVVPPGHPRWNGDARFIRDGIPMDPRSDWPAPLTFTEGAFVDYFCTHAYGNPSEAARLAGYTAPAGDGRRLMQRPEILVAIRHKMAQCEGASAGEVLWHLTRIARANLADFMKVDEEGRLVLDNEGRPSYDLKRAQDAGLMDLVESIKVTATGIELRLYPKERALKALGAFRGLTTETVQHRIDIDWDRVPTDILEKLKERRIRPEEIPVQYLKGHQVALPAPPNGRGTGGPGSHPTSSP